MIRIVSILVGLFFSVVLAWSFVTGAITTAQEGLPHTVESRFLEHPKHVAFASDGAFGRFDRQQLQRGFQVYQEVCAACHAINHVSYRDLAALGYNEAEVKAIAAAATINAPDPMTGELKDRPGLPSDRFPKVVYAGKGAPPDLSLVTKARHNGGPYVYSLLTGYADPATYKNAHGEALPKENRPGDGLYFNPYFANLNLSMPAPLTSEGQVTYADGTKATVDQMAKDVSAFLIWTAEPKLDKRKQTGWVVLGFLLLATVLAYMSYRTVWADKKGH